MTPAILKLLFLVFPNAYRSRSSELLMLAGRTPRLISLESSPRNASTESSF